MPYLLPDAGAAKLGGSLEQLLYEEQGPVARITLNRPKQRHAFSLQLSDELVRALGLVRRSETIKILIIRDAGGTFCAGDDITEMAIWGNANRVMRTVRFYQRGDTRLLPCTTG